MMKRRTQVVAIIFAAALLLPGLTYANGQKAGAKADPVRIGSKDFTESLILAEIYALALEDAGIPVTRSLNLSSSVVHTTLVSNKIDLYPEYTGTGLLAVLKLDLITDPQKVYDTVKAEYKKQFDVVWLDYADANDGQGIVVTKAASDQYGIRTITDLQRNAGNIRFASQGEFDEREDALPGLAKVYGPFNWKSTKVYDNSLKYQVLNSGEADAAPAYTTEGPLADPRYVLLEDDRHVWPPYNIAPVVRQNVLNTYPAIADILNKVNAKISTAGITALNAQVDLEQKEYEDVAKDFFEKIVKGK
jgi:osmoprotectant transport system substrate-binding protein